ncbi:hypothetical protein TrRE_jg9506 [Triparma retinervis]|uniref:Uncharacterized protein n=1 Tax=Triparma retinervis TaxID=2557542 RepID=A0A9W7G8N5_9STRA|nr:hypothetical protein TrRE_jg9506 [Triparma retinervis]
MVIIKSSFDAWRTLLSISSKKNPKTLNWANNTLTKLEKITTNLFHQTNTATKRLDPSGKLIHAVSKLLLSPTTASAINEITSTLSTLDDRIKLGPLLNSHPPETIVSASDIVHYGTYANAAYGWKGRLFSRFRFHRSDHSAICSALNIPKSDVVHVAMKATARRPGYFIARDRERRAIVLTIRGTLSVADCLTDLCVDLTEFKQEDSRIRDWIGMGDKYEAHGGMIEGAKRISIEARRSLGAGVASILGTQWRSTFPSLLVFAYGSPCIAPLRVMPTGNEGIVSVVNTGDPFATLSVGHLEDLVKGVGWMAEREGVREEVREAVKGGDRSVTERIVKEVREVMNSEKCYPPGRVYEMREMEGGEVEVWKVGQERWKEMVLQYNMLDIPKHVPFLYEDLLKKWCS